MTEPVNRTLRDMVKRLVPWWMQELWGYGYLYSLAQVGDLLIQQGIESARLGFPTHCQAEALAYHGRDRGVRRAPDESRESFVARLLAWRTTARKVGSAAAILRAVQSYSLGTLGTTPSVTLGTNTGTWFVLDSAGDITRTVLLPNPSNWDWDGETQLWDRFWIVLYASEWTPGDPPIAWTPDGTWGDGELWGNDQSSTWGSTATPNQVSAIRQLVADHQGADALCVSIILCFDDTMFRPDGLGTMPDGLYAHHGKDSGAGVLVPARSADAIYWDGTS